MRRYLVEAIGSLFLVLAFGLTNNAFAIGLILAALIYGTVHVSGSHFNPAISFAYYLIKEINLNTFIGNCISQILGAFAAAGILAMVSGTVYYVEPPTATNLYQQSTIEVLLTFIFAFAYLSLYPLFSSKSIRLNALGVGLTLTAVILIGETISGAVFNPALSIGTSIVDLLTIQGASFQYIPLYTLAPIAGASLAALFHIYLRR